MAMGWGGEDEGEGTAAGLAVLLAVPPGAATESAGRKGHDFTLVRKDTAAQHFIPQYKYP